MRSKTVALVVALLAALFVVPLFPASAQALDRVPRDFHWGVATSGFQSEGHAPDSNWRRYVRGGASTVKDPYKDSVDFRNRYRSDIRRAKRLGVNTFRFGIEWARVEPRDGRLNRPALRYYDDVIRRVRAAGMTPMITLDHWVYPGWVADQGAWDNPKTVDDWLTNARRIVKRYRGMGVMWITINEATTYLDYELKNRELSPVQLAQMQQALVHTHRRAYDLIHRIDPGTMVSSNIAYQPPPLGVSTDNQFINHVRDKLDFFGLDYYYGASVDNVSSYHGATAEYWKIEPQPDGILYALREYSQKFPDLPFMIVENGFPTDNGKPREDGYTRSNHLSDTIFWVQRAMTEGIDVIGYNYWSLTDNYEWGSYRPRFGLYTVDVLKDPTLTRRPTDAVATYRRLIRRGGVPSSYTPVKDPAFCAPADLIATCLGPLLPVPLGR
ncbi:MAG TPA: family 1 glycosylhydrolase [Nocardioidaceae bacterium]|nr:family 1 glycosylhydrolase [Nocardioidaceae bacterium]